jgi:hypothetical protein
MAGPKNLAIFFDINNNMAEIFYLIPLLYDFYLKEFRPFADMEIKKFESQQECIIEMNNKNRKLQAEFSAIRVVCQPKIR